MDTLGVDNAYAEPQTRTVRLPAALAVGAAATVVAFGAGYALAPALDRPIRATVAEPLADHVHTWSTAVAESFALKQRGTGPGANGAGALGKAADVRYERVR